MGPGRFPAVGAQARRKADGILGEVYATDPAHQLLSVRWATVPGAYAWEDYTPDQFARCWELTGIHIPRPRETHAAVVLISLLVLLFFGGVVLHDSLSSYHAYNFYQPASVDAGILHNAEALNRKYGLMAAETCAAGADDYIRSLTSHSFRWDSTQMLTPHFDEFSHSVSAPGVLTMISTHASISDGFGTFRPIRLDCNYDTQSREVLSYGAEGLKP